MNSKAWIAISLLCSTACADDAVPDFVDDLAGRFAAESPETAPLEIWSYSYRGSTVYYVTPRCCDLPGVLYDEMGVVICRAGGGIAGNYNDGNCPEFVSVRKDGKRLWRHPEHPED